MCEFCPFALSSHDTAFVSITKGVSELIFVLCMLR